MNYYVATIGTAEFSWFGGTDEQAIKKVRRWIKMFWAKFKSQYPGSLWYAINNKEPRIRIGKIWCDTPGIIPCVDYTIILDECMEENR